MKLKIEKAIEKIIETKSWFFKRLIKLINLYKTDKDKKKTEMSNIKNGYYCRPCRHHQKDSKGIL